MFNRGITRLSGLLAVRPVELNVHSVRFFAALSPQRVDETIASESVVLFTKSYCNYCRDLVERLVDAEIPHKEIALDNFGP